jgi:hypothetical protein
VYFFGWEQPFFADASGFRQLAWLSPQPVADRLLGDPVKGRDFSDRQVLVRNGAH